MSFSCNYNVYCRLLASGANCLLIAASTGDHNEVKRLVEEEKISPSHEFKHGLTALHEACDVGRLSTVKMLIDLKANVNKQVHIHTCECMCSREFNASTGLCVCACTAH